MSLLINPYLNFNGNAREAVTFYQSVLGGEVSMLTFGQMGGEGASADLLMHSQLETPDGLVLMCSDLTPEMEFKPGNTASVSLSGDEPEKLRGFFDALSEGGNVETPLFDAPWGDQFGAFTDRFGVSWLVNIAPPANGT